MLNSSTWVQALPATVVAFFQLRGSDPNGVSVNSTRVTHQAFLQYYNLTDEAVPLLEYDNTPMHGTQGPFREIRNHLLKGTRYSTTTSASSEK